MIETVNDVYHKYGHDVPGLMDGRLALDYFGVRRIRVTAAAMAEDTLRLEMRVVQLIEANNAEVERRREEFGRASRASRTVDALAGELLTADRECSLLRGAIRASDERLRDAAAKVDMEFGCDTPAMMAEEIIRLRKERDNALEMLDAIKDALPDSATCNFPETGESVLDNIRDMVRDTKLSAPVHIAEGRVRNPAEAKLRFALQRQAMANILEFRRQQSGRYGALTKKEIESVIADIDAALEGK